MKWSRSPFFSPPPPRAMPDSSLSDCPSEDRRNFKSVKSWKFTSASAGCGCENKPSLKLVDCAAKIWFRLSQMWLCGEWLPHKAFQSVCKRISPFFFLPTFPQLINEQASPLSAPICQVKGYQAFLYVKLEHIGAVAWFIGEFNSSIRLLMTHSSDGAGRIQR